VAFNTALHPRGPNGRFTRSFAVHMSSLDGTKASKVKAAFHGHTFHGPDDAHTYLNHLSGVKAPGKDGGGGGIRQYLDNGTLRTANEALRAGKGDHTAVHAIDATMKPLPDDLQLFRSVPQAKFGKVDPKSLEGMKVSDAGYFPATIAPQKAGPGTVQLHVQAPAGTPAAADPDSGQVVLGHGAEMAVDSVDTAPDGSTRMNLVVLPGEGADGPTGPADTPAAPSPAQGDITAQTGVGDIVDGEVPSILDNDAASADRRTQIRDNLAAAMNGTFGRFTLDAGWVTRYWGGPDGENPGVQVRLAIRDANGTEIGRAMRALYRDDNGDLVAVHELLEIDDPNQQGGGLAAAFNAHLTDWYREQGVSRIELTANIDVGGYAWASHGYDFADETSANGVLDRLRTSLHGATGADADAGRALLARAEAHPFGSAGYPTPFEISQLGRPTGPAGQGRGATWLGKDVMLGSAWEGTKWL
jgi:hypothetical protein